MFAVTLEKKSARCRELLAMLHVSSASLAPVSYRSLVLLADGTEGTLETLAPVCIGDDVIIMAKHYDGVEYVAAGQVMEIIYSSETDDLDDEERFERYEGTWQL